MLYLVMQMNILSMNFLELLSVLDLSGDLDAINQALTCFQLALPHLKLSFPNP